MEVKIIEITTQRTIIVGDGGFVFFYYTIKNSLCLCQNRRGNFYVDFLTYSCADLTYYYFNSFELNT